MQDMGNGRCESEEGFIQVNREEASAVVSYNGIEQPMKCTASTHYRDEHG